MKKKIILTSIVLLVTIVLLVSFVIFFSTTKPMLSAETENYCANMSNTFAMEFEVIDVSNNSKPCYVAYVANDNLPEFNSEAFLFKSTYFMGIERLQLIASTPKSALSEITPVSTLKFEADEKDGGTTNILFYSDNREHFCSAIAYIDVSGATTETQEYSGFGTGQAFAFLVEGLGKNGGMTRTLEKVEFFTPTHDDSGSNELVYTYYN